MNKKEVITCLCLLFLFIGLNDSIFAQKCARNYNLLFNYDDEVDFGWLKGDGVLMMIDSTFLINGKYPLCVKQSPSKYRFLPNAPLMVLLTQEFPIPDTINSKIQITLHAKTKNLDVCMLKSIRIGNNEDVIGQDSVIINHEEWSTDTLNLSLENTNRLIVGILAIGIEDSLKWNDAMESVQGAVQQLWLDRMEIQAGGRDISHKFISPIFSDKLLEDCITPLDTNDLYQNVYIPEGKRIVALGESIHGSSTVRYYQYELIKKLVLEKKCRLVLLESPILYTPYWNLLIQGRIAEKTLRMEMAGLLPMMGHDMCDFFLWLKDFNSTVCENDKVYIAGIADALFPDMPFNPLYKAIRTCFDDLDNENSTISNMMYKEIVFNLMQLLSGKMQMEEAQIYVEQHARELKDVMGNANYDIFNYTLSRIKLAGSPQKLEQAFRSFQSRDYSMFQNSQWFIQHCLSNDCTVGIVAHWRHTDKKNGYNIYPYIYSMGYYFQKYYGDSYFNIGFTVGAGEIISLLDLSISHLMNPVDASLERLCLERNLPCFYYYDTKHAPLCVPVRYTGNKYLLPEFNYQGDINKRVDAFVFIRESKISLEQKNFIHNKRKK